MKIISIAHSLRAGASCGALAAVVWTAQALFAPHGAFAASSTAASSVRSNHLNAIELALKGDTKGALALAKPLAVKPMSAEEHDRVLLTLGRIYYQAGDDAAAVESYSQVRKGSASWPEALEERASAYMRMGHPQDALASLKTVLTPLYKDRILSEPYYLAALAQLRVCDFKSVFKTLDLFKDRFRDRVSAWESAAQARTGSANTDRAAQLRLAEVRETIQKLNLLEAEAIQRLYIDESGKRASGSVPKIAREAHQLTFPVDSDSETKEVWIDEVDDYRVSFKGCPTAGFAAESAAESASKAVAAKEKSL